MTEPTKEDYAQYIKLISDSTMNMVLMADKIGDKHTMALMSAFGIIFTLGEEEDNVDIIQTLKPIMKRILGRITNGHRDFRDILERLD